MAEGAIRRLAWLSDLHLDFLKAWARLEFYQSVARCEADGVVISGDISTAVTLEQHLCEMADALRVPIWFVLGNHDYYGSGAADVKREAARLKKANPLLRWLPREGVVALNPHVALVGVDSWADGRAGDYWGSEAGMTDHWAIRDFVGRGQTARLRVMRRHADAAERMLRVSLDAALSAYRTVYVASHVPIYREGYASPAGGRGGGDYLPFYVWQGGGEAVAELVGKHKGRRVIVLCGHAHTRRKLSYGARTTVCVAKSVYGSPAVEEVIALAAR